MPFLVGAYAAAPADPAAAEFTDYFRALAAQELIGGLELPSHHLGADATKAITSVAPADWTYALTCFPGTMFALADNPAVGLASTDPQGRAHAVDLISELREQVLRFDAAAGGGRVRHVMFHSAPRGGAPEALAESLSEISAWDWADARLEIEHCDALIPGQDPQKGFLALADELAVLSDIGSMGVVINWGRSAIEARSAEGPIQHLRQARKAGLLSGLMFSGAAPVTTDYGAPWLDAHLDSATRVPGSLMTPEEMRRSLQVAGDDIMVGAKIGVRPTDATIADRIAVIVDLLDEIVATRG